MKAFDVPTCAAELFSALRTRTVVEPLTVRYPGISVDDAYRVSLEFLNARLLEGERVIGKKIGVTSLPVQRMLDVYQPDFGYLTDAMVIPAGAPVPVSSLLIQPRAEAEIAFVMRHDLQGPGVTAAQVLAALDFAMPCFEIVDSRIRDWKIRIEDTVADNASCGLVVLGNHVVDARALDLALVGCVVEKNGEVLSTGAGAAALGSPVNSVAWLANTLGRFGVPLRAGEIILSGSLVPLEPVKAGDVMRMSIDRIGSLTARFT
jgi:2-oxopent-4-enoate/cis-2-oxohex-4-enoate hydratase